MATDLEKDLSNLEWEVQSTAEELANLASKVAEWVDESKVQNLKDTINKHKETLRDIKKDLDTLTWDEKKEKEEQIQKLEAELQDLERSIWDIETAAASVPEADNWGTPEWWDWDKPKERKLRNWFEEQRKCVTSSEEWKNNKGTNILRVVWWVWIIWWTVALFKRIFHWKSDKSRDNDGKWFWQRPFGKTLKRIWIIGSGYYLVHGLITWKWNPKDIAEWGLTWRKERVKDAEDQVNDYESLSEEEREKYETVGGKVNDMFEKTIWSKEISLWYENDTQLWRISNNVKFKQWKWPANYKWLVPYCMDCDSDNIGEVLSESDINEYIFNKDLSELKNDLKGSLKSKLGKLLYPFAEHLQSFQVFGTQPWKSMWEKIEAWLESGDEKERQEELNLFFRQYFKVLTFLKDKQTLLQYKVAEEILSRDWYVKDWKKKDMPTKESDKAKFIKKALEDEDWFKENIEKDSSYKQYMDWKIKWCYGILQSKWILNTKPNEWEEEQVEPISKDLAYRLTKLDEHADDLLQVDDDETVVDKWISEFDKEWNINKTKSDLIELCDDFSDDIANESWTWFFQEYFDWVCYAANMEDKNREEIWNESWLWDRIDEMKQVFESYKEKIKSWEVTKQDLEELKKISMEYVAMKKEVEVATFTMTKVKSEAPNRLARMFNTLLMAWKRRCTSVMNILRNWWSFWDWVSLIVISWTVYLVSKPGKRILVPAATAATWTLEKVADWVSRAWWKMMTPSWLLKKQLASMKGSLASKQSFFLHHVLNWHVGGEERLLEAARDTFKIEATSMPEVIQKMLSETNPNITIEQAEMLREYRDYRKLRRLMFDQQVSGNTIVTQRWFHRRGTYNFAVNETNLNTIRSINDNIKKMKGPNGKFFNEWQDFVKKLLRKVGKAGDLAEVYNVSDNIMKVLSLQWETYCKSILQFYKRSPEIEKALKSGSNLDISALDDALSTAKKLYYTRKAHSAIRESKDLEDLVNEIILTEKYIEKGWVWNADDMMSWINKFRKEITSLNADDFGKSYKAVKHLLTEIWTWAEWGTALMKTIKTFKIINEIDEIPGETRKLSKIIWEGNIDEIIEALNKIRKSGKYVQHLDWIDSLLKTFKSIKNLNKLDDIWSALQAIRKIIKIFAQIS